MNGEEYHKLLTQAEPYRARFARMSFGRPLLTAAEDYAALGRALMEALPAQRADTAVLYMGHGSEHQANSAYALMEYAFHDLGRKDVVIGTVEGYPGFGEALRRLKERPQVRRVELRPLMTVAGDHAKNDLAGDEEDSWRRRLEAEGYETVCVLTGLGEHPAVRALFVEHARQAWSSSRRKPVEYRSGGRKREDGCKSRAVPAAVREQPVRTGHWGDPGRRAAAETLKPENRAGSEFTATYER